MLLFASKVPCMPSMPMVDGCRRRPSPISVVVTGRFSSSASLVTR